MSNKLKEIVIYAAAFIAIFIVPQFGIRYYQNDDKEYFYGRMKENHETCRRYAKEDSREMFWCNEIEKAATITYRETKNSDNSRFLLLLFQPLLFVLLISLYHLGKQVKELKEKIDA